MSSPTDIPIRPGIQGTQALALPGTHVVCGREHVGPALIEMLSRSGAIATDIETFGLGALARRLKAVTIADADTAIVLDPRDDRQRRMIQWAYRQASSITFHNSTFDVPSLYLNGLLGLAECATVWDTLIWARLAWPDALERKGLEPLAHRLLGLSSTPVKGLFAVNGWRTMAAGYLHADLDLPAYITGAAMDGIVTARLRPLVRSAALDTLTRNHPFGDRSRIPGVTGADAERLVDREQGINRMLLRRACTGMLVDQQFASDYADATTRAQHDREQVMLSNSVRPGNGQDLARYVTAVRPGRMVGWPRTKTGYRMTKTDVARLADIPLAAAFAEHKLIKKIKSDYLDKVSELADDNGRIHPVTDLLKAVTGRSSMGGPPIHQFPEGARPIILPDPGDAFASIDWKQQEPALAANTAGDMAILAGYEDGTEDFYTSLAARAGITRKVAKVVVLALLYGEGMEALGAALAITEDEAARLRTFVFRAMPKVKDLLMRLRVVADRYRQVPTLSGRILPIPMGTYGVQVHKGVNYYVQGSGWDLMAETLVTCEERDLGDAIYFGMHDELVVSDDAAQDIRTIMETPPPRLVELAGRVPVLRTDYALMGDHWRSV
jgi:DNA polymerase-1